MLPFVVVAVLATIATLGARVAAAPAWWAVGPGATVAVVLAVAGVAAFRARHAARGSGGRRPPYGRGGDLGGVREPRRPAPSSGHLAAALDLPSD